MGWSIGTNLHWHRDIGYGVPAICDHPGCGAEIDRGLDYVCGDGPEGGETGCGLHFCTKHRAPYRRRVAGLGQWVRLCERCGKRSKKGWFTPTPDTLEWIQHKLTDESWAEWRREHPEEVAKMAARVEAEGAPDAKV